MTDADTSAVELPVAELVEARKHRDAHHYKSSISIQQNIRRSSSSVQAIGRT